MIYKNNKIKVIFIGTPDFGIPAFKALLEDKQFEIIAVITQPDMPVGRKQVLTPPPIKEIAIRYGLPVLQPKQIARITKKITQLQPDLIIVIAYAQLITENILQIPKYGCINVHGSLLPKYRGAAVTQAPILNGDKQTGVTIMKMDQGLDKGPILAQNTVNITSNETAGSLYDKLSELSAPFLLQTLKQYIRGKIKPLPQNQSKASFVKIIKKQDGLIDWTKPAQQLERFIRAMTPWPSTWTHWQDKRIKIISVQKKLLAINSYKPGKTFLYNSGLAVQTGRESLIIKKLQLEGKKEMTSAEFLRGHENFIGNILS